MRPDPVGKMLGTRFDQFRSNVGIDGLARYNGNGMIELLAVHARTPGKGQFRRFIANLKKEYKTICVWEISNPLLETVLPRYGFKREVTIDSNGETLAGFRYDRPAAS